MFHLLDFDGQRLVGERPFAAFEAKDGAFHWHRLEDTSRDFPFESGRGDALSEIRHALGWCREKCGEHGAAVGFMAYDFARQLEPRAFTKHSPPDDLQIPDIRLTFCANLKREPTTSNEQLS